MMLSEDLFFDVPHSVLESPWELVYFIYPSCDGNCKHCWSSDTLLGSKVGIEWHEAFIKQLQRQFIKEIKLSGGEPFLNKDIGKIINYIQKYVSKGTPITIFTSGRTLFSLERGQKGVFQSIKNIKNNILNLDNVCLQISIDEFHIEVFRKYLKKTNNPFLINSDISDEDFMEVAIKNMVETSKYLQNENPNFRGIRFKMHCNENRLLYHRNKIYGWMDDDFWDQYIIATEGLIKSGNAKEIPESSDIKEGKMWSFFVLPGVSFFNTPQSNKFQEYYSKMNHKKYYLDKNLRGGVIIAGWWNLINKTACFKQISPMK